MTKALESPRMKICLPHPMSVGTFSFLHFQSLWFVGFFGVRVGGGD